MSLGIRINEERCNLCGFCVDSCPVSLFTFDEGETRIVIGDLADCLVCRNCEDHCRRRCLVVDFPEWPHRSTVEAWLK